ANHAVTGDDHRNRISRVRHANVPRERRVTELRGQLSVRTCLAVRNAQQQGPYALLECVSLRGQRHVETGALATKIFVELPNDGIECCVVARAQRRRRGAPTVTVEVKSRKI